MSSFFAIDGTFGAVPFPFRFSGESDASKVEPLYETVIIIAPDHLPIRDLMTQTVCGFIRVHGHVQNIHIGCHGNERCCRVVAKRRRRRCSGIFVRLLLLPAFLSHTFTFAVFSFPGGGVVVVTAATGCCSFLLSLYFQFLFKSCEIRVESSYMFVDHLIGLYCQLYFIVAIITTLLERSFQLLKELFTFTRW